MASPRQTALLLLLVAISVQLLFVSGGSADVVFIHPRKAAECQGTLDECLGIDAGSRRSVLSTTGYISYDALRRDVVPCSLTGASYYNCQPGAASNPYSRGCSAITQCRGS
ncbi:rapid alkalinization factor-like [Typha latifolia]|uniref:rapid alkalinization factor-like n=1 Tax=Typha latifolia TaxID=4733 RepID=UPI003C2F4B8D